MTTLAIHLAIIFSFTVSVPGAQSITTSHPVATMQDCRTAEGIVKLLAYYDGSTVRTACRESRK